MLFGDINKELIWVFCKALLLGLWAVRLIKHGVCGQIS